MQSYKVNENVKWSYNITIPHGSKDPVNIGIYDPKTKDVIAKDVYTAPTMGGKAGDHPIEWKVPQALDGKCKALGDCVALLTWTVTAKPLTYQSCVDMIVTA